MFSLLTKGGLSARFKAVTGIEIAISNHYAHVRLASGNEIIPEPGTLVLLLTGGLGLVAYASRRWR